MAGRLRFILGLRASSVKSSRRNPDRTKCAAKVRTAEIRRAKEAEAWPLRFKTFTQDSMSPNLTSTQLLRPTLAQCLEKRIKSSS